MLRENNYLENDISLCFSKLITDEKESLGVSGLSEFISLHMDQL